MKKVIGILLTIALSVSTYANYLEKAEIEENIQKKAQHILDTMYGHIYSP